MLRGLYTAATGMAVQRANMDVLTNNIVNASTAGFKRDGLITSSFDEVMIERLNGPYRGNANNEVGPYSFGAHIDQVYTDFSQGSTESTGKQTDLAIYGDGFFAVETPAGERYTRSGSFSVNREGYLVTADGNYVLGQNGRLNVGYGSFSVDGAGYVSAGGQVTDRLRIVRFEETGNLRKQGYSLFAADNAAPAEAGDVSIMQGFLEGSNVDIATEMTDMITVYRAYEANQRILSMTDETLGLAVNNLGSLR
ncbi:MAG: flagellar basal-body rod protein FlgF [Oscillospiraceae bacterium]|jgi:flagellar basal-body rod protein FlgF